MHRQLGRWLSKRSAKTDKAAVVPNDSASSAVDQTEQNHAIIQDLGPGASKPRASSELSLQGDGCGSSKPSLPPPEESAYGLKELVGQSPENRNAVDIVAIHGLNGHREKTWADKTTRVNWLSDPSCLPKDIPNARVLSFGYKSTSYFSRSDSDVRDFASELLSALRASRKSQIEKQRPIIFVCHSLGGIVFKQAVVRAHEQDHFYASLLEKIQGVVFFATPHRGSDLALWGSIASRVVQAATLGFTTNAKLSQDLKVNSEMLKSISDSFAYRGGNFRVRSFYETEFMPKLNCRVVDKDSATLGWGNELDIASSSNHSNICKFPSPVDQRYQTAVFAISEMIDIKLETVNPPFTASQEKCMEQLNAEYEHHLGQIDDPVPGTCEWVLSHQKFQQWQSWPGSSLLWITSSAGCGKSVMAKFLVNHFQAKREAGIARNFGYFFFMDGVGNQDNASATVSALLHQLYHSQHGLISHALKKFEGTPSHVFGRFSTLWPVLVSSVDDASANDIVWVLDGLDECEPKSLRQFITTFSNFFDSRSSTESQLSKTSLKIILLSRPNSLMQQILGLFADKDLIRVEHNNKFRLAGEDESQAITADILQFAQRKINDLASASALPGEVLERLEKRLVVGADFTFLWISLVIKMVEDSTVNGISVAGVESILNTSSLDDVYRHLLLGTSRTHLKKTRKLLSIILASARPLTIEEMCVAVEVEADYSDPRTESIQLLGRLLHRPFDNHVRQLCGHFVRIRRRKLYFVHQTARAFLMTESFGQDSDPQPSRALSLADHDMAYDANETWKPINLDQANSTLLKICVAYIRMFEAEGDVENDSSWNDGQIAQYLEMCKGNPPRAFFPYAAVYWVQHYRPVRKQLDHQYDELLQPGTKLFEAWIKVHTSWVYEYGLNKQIAGHEADNFDETLKVLSPLAGDGLAYIDGSAFGDLRRRFDILQDWLRQAWFFRKPASPLVLQKFSELKEGLEQLILHASLGISWTAREDDIKAYWASVINRHEHHLMHLQDLANDLDEERQKAFAANPDFKQSQAERVVSNLNEKIAFETQNQAMLQQVKKEEDLHEVLVHFGLFDLDEGELGEDEFLGEYWQSRIHALNEHREVDGEEEDDYGDLQIEAGIPNRVKHYIREKQRRRIRGSLVANTPGAELPGLSNPEAWSFQDRRISHLGPSSR